MKITRDGKYFLWTEEYNGKTYGQGEIYEGDKPDDFQKEFEKIAKNSWDETKKELYKNLLK